MKHSLQLRLSQHLTLTPQLQQSIRLLQLSTLELNQEIERFLQDNPLLERDEGARRKRPPRRRPLAPATPTTPRPADPPPPRQKENRVGRPRREAEQRLDRATTAPVSYGGHDDDEDTDSPQIAAEPPSLREHLLSQVNLLQLPDRDKTHRRPADRHARRRRLPDPGPRRARGDAARRDWRSSSRICRSR